MLYYSPKRICEAKIMKIDWYKAASALQLIIGAAAIISFFVLAFGGENIKPWIITVILAVVLTVSGIIGLVKGSPYNRG